MAEASITIDGELAVSFALWGDGKLTCYLDADNGSDGGIVSLSMAGLSALVAAIHACRKSLAHQLYAEGWNKRQIGIALSVGRRTIQLWLKEREES